MADAVRDPASNLIGLRIHGPGGRIAVVRGWLGLPQLEFAKELVAYGGRASRETVSHWENLDGDGVPRSRMTRRNSAAMAALVRDRLRLDLGDDLFYDPDETAWDALGRRQLEMAAQLAALARSIDGDRAAIEAQTRQHAEIAAHLDEIAETLKALRMAIGCLVDTNRDRPSSDTGRRDQRPQAHVA